MTGRLGKLHVEHLHNLFIIYFSLNVIRTSKSRSVGLAEHVARMVEKRNPYKFFVGKPKGMRPLRRPGRNWADNVKRNLREIEWGYTDCINFARDRDQWRALVITVMTLRCL